MILVAELPKLWKKKNQETKKHNIADLIDLFNAMHLNRKYQVELFSLWE